VSDISVQPTNDYAGPCPVRFAFTAKITMNVPGDVRYRWVRNGDPISVQSVTIRTPGGVVDVNDSRSVSGQSGSQFTGAQAIEILAPNTAASKTDFRVSCR